MRGWVFMVPFIALAAMASSDQSVAFHVERHAVSGGSELLTVFGRLPDGKTEAKFEDVPLVSVLRDTLGDENPLNDRLRYVWVLSSASPTLLQRAASALPFYYWHADAGKNADHRPIAVIDLGAPARSVWTSVAGSLTQVAALDPEGAIVRASTRSYRNNYADHRRLHLLEGLAVLSQLDHEPEVQRLFSDPELIEIQSRMTLAGQTLGGLVSPQRLPDAYAKQRTRDDEARGHNWDLLRQKAESDGLYFEPIGLGATPTLALLWIATEDLAKPPAHYDGQFLGFANPYTDDRLRQWTGYHIVRDGRDMIPLGLYSLEYPKVPLLVVDFRDTHGPKRREMFRHAVTDTVSGVLGISMWSNWPLLTSFTAWNFIRERHGAASDRAARIRAYSQTRQWVTLDPSLDPALRTTLLKHLEILGVNPLEDSIFAEGKIARRQYTSLLQYADNPQGLPARIDYDRNEELEAYYHGFGARTWFHVAHYATFGVYRHREATPAATVVALDQERRTTQNVMFLASVAKSGTDPSIVWNMDQVRRAIDDLSASGFPARSAEVVQRIMKETSDEETRQLCERALQGLDATNQ
ncbi:MAG: hypothetical protein ABSF22_19965 [Bryobacteraceae bacterium]